MSCLPLCGFLCVLLRLAQANCVCQDLLLPSCVFIASDMRFADLSEVQETSGTVQLAAASLLGRLQVQALHGPRVTLTLQRLLPPGLVAAIQASPAVLYCLDVPSWFVVKWLRSPFNAGHCFQAASCSCAVLDVCAVSSLHHCKRWFTASADTCEREKNTLHSDPQSAQCAVQGTHVPARNKPCSSGIFAASISVTTAAHKSTWNC